MTLLGSPPVVVTPPNQELTEALDAAGVEYTVVTNPTGEELEAADVAAAGTVVLTDVDQATAIPIVNDLNPDVRVVVFATGTIPPFARPQADLIVDPSLVDATTLAEELAGQGE
jgi:hypothetical protein